MRRYPQIITAKMVPVATPLNTADDHFGIHYPLLVEPTIFQFATQLAPAYSGGYWNFHSLSNGGFFMAPKLDESFEVTADNGYKCTMSAEALGVTACLYAFSNLSFGEVCAEHYHRLLVFSMSHPVAAAVKAVID